MNASESVLMGWINTDPITQSEVSQKEKDKYTLKHIYRIWKNDIEEFYLPGSNGEIDIENKLMDLGREEERVRYMESITWNLTLPYAKLSYMK